MEILIFNGDKLTRKIGKSGRDSPFISPISQTVAVIIVYPLTIKHRNPDHVVTKSEC